MKPLLRGALPYGLVTRVQARRAAAERERLHAARAVRLREAEQRRAQDPGAWDHELAIQFLVDRGLDETEVRVGSVPEPSLRFVAEQLRAALPADRPLAGLHVGNFVGVSLAALTAVLRERHAASVLVAVDPDLPHRGIAHPAAHAMALLRHFGLAGSVLSVTAFSLGSNLGNDGIDEWDDADTLRAQLAASAASEHALDHLVALCPGGFDLVLLDGNHDAAYLEQELDRVARLLRAGGLLVLDDVDEAAWADIARVFERLFSGTAGPFERVAADGRMGIARRV